METSDRIYFLSSHLALLTCCIASFVAASQVAQSDFRGLWLWGGLAFLSYALFVFWAEQVSFRHILIAALGVRFALIFFEPQLSDDVYRFIWDGRLWHQGIHPFSATPRELIAAGTDVSLALFDLLNSPDYRTIYPPIAQLSFYVASFFESPYFRGEIMVMKVLLFVAELISFWVLLKLLEGYITRAKRFALYALNPLVIIEIMGNMHHEGYMICFVLLTLYFFDKKQFVPSGIMMGLAIASKLLPLMFCPILFFAAKGKDRMLFFLACAGTCFSTFGIMMYHLEYPWLLFESLDLYLRKFEFNASFYYILREIGFWLKGYNLIHILGPVCAVSIALWTIWISLWRTYKTNRQIVGAMILIYLSFVLLSPTVHPWYILLLIALATLTSVRSFYIWSGLILLSYIHYSFESFGEVIWLTALQYGIVFGSIYAERRRFYQLLKVIKYQLS